MARVTIEDCIEKVPSRFELVILAAQRTKDISAGAKPLIDRDNDKDAVIALREIAQDKLVPDQLREAVVKRHQLRQSADDEDQPDESTEDQEEITKELSNFSMDKKDLSELSNLYEDDEIDEE